MAVFCSDYGSSKLLFSEPNCAPANGRIRIEISNNTISYYNYTTGVSKTWSPPYIFALNGQSDLTGPVDYKLYTGINRVVAGRSDRVGSGVLNTNITIN